MKNLSLHLLLFFSSTATAQSIFDSLFFLQAKEIYFETGRAELSAAANATLDSAVQVFKQEILAEKIEITAHTDSVGKADFNKKLSERRATAVAAALETRGIEHEKLRISTFGESRPAAENSTDAGRQRNRRATVKILRAVPMTTISGQVKNQKTGAGISATVVFATKTRADSVKTDSSGKFSVRLPTDSVVRREVFAQGYFFDSEVSKIFGSPELLLKSKFSGEIQLPPAAVGEKVVLKNLFFVGNRDTLLKISEPELPKILRFMQINPTLKIEIGGHINLPGTPPEKIPKWEQELSVRRARRVFNFLKENGIDESRLKYKGYGNSQMLFPKPKNELESEQNRRVEIRVIE